MMKGIQLLLLVAVIALANADFRVSKEHTTLLSTPQGWSAVRRADDDHMTRITIAVTQSNLDMLEDFFWRVSDPTSGRYASHMPLEQINALVAPTQAAKDAVTAWLSSNGITNFAFAPSGDFIIAYGTVQQIEQLLGTQYNVYKHSTTGQELVRALAPYTVPSSVAPHIDFVGGLTHFPKTKAIKTSAPLDTVTPSVVKSFFNIPATITGTAKNNSQAVAQFLGQYYDPEDLTTFQKKYNLPVQAVTKVVGPNQASNPGIEASLDIEYIMAVAPKVPTWFVYTDGLYEGQEPFLDWIVNMSSDPNAPFVHSVSYGDDESTISYAYAARVNYEFMKYGSEGRSILFASGDDGTGCKSTCDQFLPNWPASSPYVTAVGGIYLNGNTPVADTIASGGFSNFFSQPSYQSSAVNAYLSSHSSSPAPSYYNATGRAIPDIASFSEDVEIEWLGSFIGVSGTSCAAPVISGVISLLNDARINSGKEPLGFLNPFLYQTLATNPSAFIDVTQGNNQNGCCAAGFSADQGWDPITGVGVPNFPVLLKAALALP